PTSYVYYAQANEKLHPPRKRDDRREARRDRRRAAEAGCPGRRDAASARRRGLLWLDGRRGGGRDDAKRFTVKDAPAPAAGAVAACSPSEAFLEERPASWRRR